MVIPWAGFPLAELISAAEPTSKAKFVHFVTLYSKEQFPAHKNNAYLPWPYEEALRMDEAMNELTLMAAGMYGQELANTNGAPLRVLVPWKYGFKSIKSIVKIEFVEDQPRNTWNVAIPHEYGFYANVNPDVDHPRWSQGMERRIGNFFRQRTQKFNGYGYQVARMYDGMDLARNY
jgi:sulfoxide reductase catalytic subunit YedY